MMENDMKPWEVIQKLESDNSRLFKEATVTENLDVENFQDGVIMALNPFITFGVSSTIPTKQSDVEGQWFEWEDFESLANQLANRELTGNAARDAIQYSMDNCSMDAWNLWYRRILLKDFKCGTSRATFEKCGMTIPSFNCMLATNGENNKHMKGECLVEYKYDGVRAITIVKDNVATIYSRNGKVLSNFPHIEKALSHPRFNNKVFDGEVMSEDFQSLMKQVHRKSGAQTEDAYLALFDILTLEEFQTGKSLNTVIERKEWINALNEMGGFDDCIRVVAYEQMNIDTETDRFKQMNKVALDNGYEGLMIKPVQGIYECKRSKGWFKIKPFIELTLTCVDVEEGTGKNKDSTGALVCEGTDEGVFIKVNVGSGLSDADRDNIWSDVDSVIGQLVEVRADHISQNQDGSHSLRFPRFKTFRGFEPGEKL